MDPASSLHHFSIIFPCVFPCVSHILPHVSHISQIFPHVSHISHLFPPFFDMLPLCSIIFPHFPHQNGEVSPPKTGLHLFSSGHAPGLGSQDPVLQRLAKANAVATRDPWANWSQKWKDYGHLWVVMVTMVMIYNWLFLLDCVVWTIINHCENHE